MPCRQQAIASFKSAVAEQYARGESCASGWEALGG